MEFASTIWKGVVLCISVSQSDCRVVFCLLVCKKTDHSCIVDTDKCGENKSTQLKHKLIDCDKYTNKFGFCFQAQDENLALMDVLLKSQHKSQHSQVKIS